MAGDEFNPDAPFKFALVLGTSHRTVYEQTTVTYVDAAEYLPNLLISQTLCDALKQFKGLGLYAPHEMKW